jgi:vancomycin resistance protein YoaR
VISPGEELSFLEEINYDPQEQELYKAWFTVVLDEDQTEYGGGLCGASTAVYQWLLTNTAIEPAERRAHTQRHGYLYDAEVNGEVISTPWLDSTIYDGHIDYKIKNTAPYPIVVVSNYDGTSWGLEEVFSLAKTEHQGSFEHDYARPNRSTIVDNWVRKTVRWWCYGWIINWEERESCYKNVN